VKLATHRHLLPNLSIQGAVPPAPSFFIAQFSRNYVYTQRKLPSYLQEMNDRSHTMMT